MNWSRNAIIQTVLARAEPRGKSNLEDQIRLAMWGGYSWLAHLRGNARKQRLAQVQEPTYHPQVPGIRTAYDSAFFRTHITTCLLPFWEQHAIDKTYGGFLHHLNRDGTRFDDQKSASMQSRMIYAFSVGSSLDQTEHYLALAEQGYKFLIEHFWDDTYGGWYESVFRDGREKNTDKVIDDHAYVLIGLIEYYRQTRDTLAYQYITQTYDVVYRTAWDDQYLGYYEGYSRRWDAISYKKTISVHLDMMTSLVLLAQCDPSPWVSHRLKQVADLIISRMYNPQSHCVLETFYKDWRYNPLASMDGIKFGHNLKAAWLFLETYRIIHDQAYVDFSRTLLDFCLKSGWDHRHNGFFQYAYRHGSLASREKVWWAECEGLPVLPLIYLLTANDMYLDYFYKLAHFIFTHFFDRDYGEWFTICCADGTVKDDRKGYNWKAAYHTVQACYYAFQYMREILDVIIHVEEDG